MKVHLLEKGIEDFVAGQLAYGDEAWYFPHSIVGHFHDTWYNQASMPLADRFSQCLTSNLSQRWWKRDHYRPKEIMLHLIEADPELAAIAWKDLQQPNASLDGRLSRFNYYCEQLLALHRGRHPKSIETFHHQDGAMMSLYLAGLFPEQYALYPGLDVFRMFCQQVGSPDIPKVDDLVRYMKVAGITFTFLQRNAQYASLLEQRGQSIHKIKCIPFQMTYEIICFLGSPNDKQEA